MFGYLRVSRARKIAASKVIPLIESSEGKFGVIPTAVWQQPYMIGFLSILISLIAQRETQGHLNSDQLGLVQLEAWPDITGQSDDSIGENICVLSNDKNEAFIEGCENAHRFLAALDGQPDPDDPGLADIYESQGIASSEFPAGVSQHNQPFGKGGTVAARLWMRYFEQYIQN